MAALAVGSALRWLPAADAEEAYGQPVYPGYQGFLENSDGSVTMVFQYFSHGRDTVELPIGPGNHFTGVEDRNQPTTFLPGNHEFVCVIVVENREEAAQLRWSVSFAGTETSTSLDPLNLEYLLVERSQEEAERALDFATAPRGVCLNKPPSVRTNRLRRRFGAGADEIEEIEAKVGEALELKGDAEDEGLPRGSSVSGSWSQVSGPGAAVFAKAEQFDTSVTFDAAGTYELELQASDGELTGSDRIRVKVGG
jgi:hypothetical protein